METTKSRKELANYILNEANDAVIDEIKQLIQERDDEIVGFTTEGKPLTKSVYMDHIESISHEVKNGAKTYTAEEVREYVMNQKQR